MAKKRFVNTKFWDDSFILTLPPEGKLLFLYLITNSLTDICGIYEISIERIIFDTKLSADTVKKCLSLLTYDNKILYIDGWIIIKNFPKYFGDSPKVKEGAKRSLASVPKSILAKVSKLDIQYPYSIKNNDTVPIESEQPTPTPTPTPTPKGSSKEDRAKPRQFGDPQINECIEHLKSAVGTSLDGTMKDNRMYARHLLNRMKKDYPDKEPLVQVKALIDYGLRDDFHGKNITSFKYLYYNAQKIIQSVQSKKSRLIVV